MAESGNPDSISEALVAVLMDKVAKCGADLNVRINAAGQDKTASVVLYIPTEANLLGQQAAQLEEAIMAVVLRKV